MAAENSPFELVEQLRTRRIFVPVGKIDLDPICALYPEKPAQFGKQFIGPAVFRGGKALQCHQNLLFFLRRQQRFLQHKLRQDKNTTALSLHSINRYPGSTDGIQVAVNRSYRYFKFFCQLGGRGSALVQQMIHDFEQSALLHTVPPRITTKAPKICPGAFAKDIFCYRMNIASPKLKKRYFSSTATL